jgi:membrane protease YdiL (CAAX protease family)
VAAAVRRATVAVRLRRRGTRRGRVEIVGQIPIAVRAPVVGIPVLIVSVMPFLFLTQINLEHCRRVPWTALFGVALLWLLWRYLQGAGWPSSTSEVRRRWLPAGKVESRLLPPTIAAALLYGLTVASLSLFTTLWEPMPVETYATILAVTRAAAITRCMTVLMISISAGVVEEAAFRNYVQRPIRQGHGPVMSITLVALLFTLAHMPAAAILPVFIAGTLGWGLLARLSGSIVPGIIVDALVDAVFIVLMWSNPDAFEALLASAAVTQYAGWHLIFGLTTIALATAAAFVWLFRRASPDGLVRT